MRSSASILNVDSSIKDNGMRSPDQYTIDYYKAFKKAKTEAERIHIAKQAAADKNFSPCLPASMGYLASKNKPTVLLDVDGCLLKGTGLKTEINTKQIDGLMKQGFTEGYLFSSMSPENASRIDENGMTRVDLIAYLALKGFGIRGVYTQADAAPQAIEGDFYAGYYNTVMNYASKPGLIAQMGKDFEASEAARMAHFGNDSANHDRVSLFGAKTQMFKAFLEENPHIKDIWMVDDALANLLGALLILKEKKMAGEFQDVSLHLCPVNQSTWGEDYNKLFESHRQRKHQIQDANTSEMHVLFSMMGKALDMMMPGVKKSAEYQHFYDLISNMNDHPKLYNPEAIKEGFIKLTEKVAVTKSYDIFAGDFKSMEAVAECVNLLPGNTTPVNAADIVIANGGGEKVERLNTQRREISEKRNKMLEEARLEKLKTSSRSSADASPEQREEPVRPTKK